MNLIHNSDNEYYNLDNCIAVIIDGKNIKFIEPNDQSYYWSFETYQEAEDVMARITWQMAQDVFCIKDTLVVKDAIRTLGAYESLDSSEVCFFFFDSDYPVRIYFNEYSEAVKALNDLMLFL